MNRISMNALAVLLIFIVLGIAGRCDYNEEVIYSMSNATYEALKEELGENVSDSELVDEYQANREYWDSVGKMNY